jgi:hypothetical protein
LTIDRASSSSAMCPQDSHQHDRDRLGEVQRPGCALHDRVGVAQVGVQIGGRALGAAGEQGAGVCQHHGVVVGVDDLGVRGHPLGDLVGVVGGGQPGANVEVLADAGVTGQVPDRTGEEGPGGAGVLDDRGNASRIWSPTARSTGKLS